jgi:hypothetical protein
MFCVSLLVTIFLVLSFYISSYAVLLLCPLTIFGTCLRSAARPSDVLPPTTSNMPDLNGYASPKRSHTTAFEAESNLSEIDNLYKETNVSRGGLRLLSLQGGSSAVLRGKLLASLDLHITAEVYRETHIPNRVVYIFRDRCQTWFRTPLGIARKD